jgi:hypothetical protein
MGSTCGRYNLGGKGAKPANGWKLDKNIQNWLLYNVFDEAQVDEDVFAIMCMYIKGLRGGPLERLRESARESNFGRAVDEFETLKILYITRRSRAFSHPVHTGRVEMQLTHSLKAPGFKP